MELWDEMDPALREWLSASERGDIAVIADHIQRGADVNQASEALTTGLMMAVRGYHIEIIRLLLAHGADPDLENCVGFTAVTYAVLYSRSWENYYRIPRPDPRPLELLVAAGGRFRLIEAVLLNDVALARLRLDEGESVDTGEGDYHGPVLMIAAHLGHVAIVDLLLDRGANLEATDDLGQTSLMIAARYGQPEVVGHLLDRGAEINAIDWSGQSALSNAAAAGHEEIYRTLLSQGAQRNLVDALARKDLALFETLLDEQLRETPRIDLISDGTARIAMFAAGRGDVDALQILLDRGASHLDEHFDSHTLLARAARSGHVEAVQFLIDRGANIHAVGRDQLTPLAWAIREGHQEVIQLLERAGATH